MFKKSGGHKDLVRSNFQIKAPQVRVIRDGHNLGIMAIYEARRVAQDLGLDLVEIAPHAQPPVCQVMDYGKFMYEKSKKQKDKKASQTKEKEICFRYVIDDHDLETKANQAKKFLEKGIRVKLLVKFKARENAHKDQGFVVVKKCIEMIGEIGVVEKSPSLEGGTIVARLDCNPKHKKEPELVESAANDSDV
jgi:translation initiation factor IF-3